ncbi:MAG: hypothetical protein JO258_00300 [Alphaproteobacteria bacterium]|nr:hypothetical protein [Alphaproteobacteria bacterium]
MILRNALRQLGDCRGPAAGRLAFAVERAVATGFAKLKPRRVPLQPTSKSTPRCCSTRSGCPGRLHAGRAIARCAGWLAHAMEQQRQGRLVRPSSAYIGPRTAQPGRLFEIPVVAHGRGGSHARFRFGEAEGRPLVRLLARRRISGFF